MRRKRMISQRIGSYEEKDLSVITTKIATDAERYKMSVKTVTLTSHIHGYSTYYSAIVVFEEVKEND
jgi:hypothetical protein